MKYGIFLTDASFDYKTKASIIGIKETTSSKEYQSLFQNAKNPTEAEYQGIMECIKIAEQERYDNIVIFCDNKKAIQRIKKDFFNKEELKSKFWYIQFVWLPRNYMESVDFLSKNLNKQLSKELKEIKNKNAEDILNSFSEKHLHVNDIKADKKGNVIKKRISQFIKIKEEQYNSVFFKEIENLSIEELESFLINNIEEIENDISMIKDPVEKLIAQNIVDSLIGV